MRERTPSHTAAIVALLRAVADRGYTHVPDFSDPFAERLLPRAWAFGLHLLLRSFARMEPRVRARVQDNFDRIPRRVRAIDRELERALRTGCTQVVILGAGLDTRVFRLPALHGARVFEVDHPASQSFKRRKAAGLRVLADALHYVPVDFERESLAPLLTAAGLRAEHCSFWLWEGVVMYLSDAALRGNLESIAELSAPGSCLALHYHEPWNGPLRDTPRWARRFTRWLGEPQIGLRRRERMTREVEQAGFRVLRDSLVDEHARLARLLVAERV
jgi:methyltransferase (TIGR00027 family)